MTAYICKRKACYHTRPYHDERGKCFMKINMGKSIVVCSCQGFMDK